MFPFRWITHAEETGYSFFIFARYETRETMGLGYGKGRLVPTGKLGPALYVSYKISQQLVRTTDSAGSFLRQKAVVHAITPEPGQNIDFGDFDLIVGDEILRLKHIAGDPEWRTEAERLKNGIPIEDGNWDLLVKTAERLKVAVPEKP